LGPSLAHDEAEIRRGTTCSKPFCSLSRCWC
jgi:hypothetical protein